MKLARHAAAVIYPLVLTTLVALAGCEGSGGLLADGGIIGTGSIIGTVPGTLIEAYGENGEYFQTVSEITNSDRHPFTLRLPAGVSFYLVMIINEGTANEIIMPIAFPGNEQDEVFARIVLRVGEEIDLGHIQLFMDCNEVPLAKDPDEDCILDTPFLLDETQGAKNPLRQMDADDDGINDFDDDDHGYGHHNGLINSDPQDHDGDRVPNRYDDDFFPGSNDIDDDGIDDDGDENPGNLPDYNDDFDPDTLLEWNGRGMHPLGQGWRYEHGEFAKYDLDSCASCHGTDFTGTPASAGIGCFACHEGPLPEDD